MIAPLHERLAGWLNQLVVFDLHAPFVAIGLLKEVGADFVLLADADLHDLRDTSTSREMYVVKVSRVGVQPNRKRMLVRLDEVVAIALLKDVQAG